MESKSEEAVHGRTPVASSVSVGGDEYNVSHEPRCLTCTSPKREQIEKIIVQGRTYKTILRSLDLEGKLPTRNLADHVRNEHIPVAAPAVRLMQQQEGERVAEVLEPLARGVAANLSLARLIVKKVGEQMHRGGTGSARLMVPRRCEALARQFSRDRACRGLSRPGFGGQRAHCSVPNCHRPPSGRLPRRAWPRCPAVRRPRL